MRIQSTIVNNSIFIQCYDNLPGLNNFESANYFRNYCNNHNASFIFGELEENESGIYYFELQSNELDVEELINTFSKTDLINNINKSFNNKIIHITEWLKNMKMQKDI